MNKVAMIGRLTKDVESRQANNGTLIANISIAVDRRFKREGQPEADFFNCTAFGKTAEFIEKYVSKGNKVLIDGRIQNDNYEKDGVKHYSVQIMVDSIEHCESKSSSAQQTAPGLNPAPAPDANGFVPIQNDLDLPFA